MQATGSRDRERVVYFFCSLRELQSLRRSQSFLFLSHNKVEYYVQSQQWGDTNVIFAADRGDESYAESNGTLISLLVLDILHETTTRLRLDITDKR